MEITLTIDNEIALEALTESLGWSLGAIGKRLDNGTPGQRATNKLKWLELDDLAGQLADQRRDWVANG